MPSLLRENPLTNHLEYFLSKYIRNLNCCRYFFYLKVFFVGMHEILLVMTMLIDFPKPPEWKGHWRTISKE